MFIHDFCFLFFSLPLEEEQHPTTPEEDRRDVVPQVLGSLRCLCSVGHGLQDVQGLERHEAVLRKKRVISFRPTNVRMAE